MNDRFRFRVWITAPITRDVEEEKEVSFYIYNIALYDDGGIGFSRDSLLDALDKLNLTEGQCNEIEDYISDNSYSGDWEWYAISFDIIEQCTGLKDKNGKLIYENDVVDLDDSETYAVIQWSEEDGCWRIITCENSIYTFDNLYGYELTICGNIHENADLLGEDK